MPLITRRLSVILICAAIGVRCAPNDTQGQRLVRDAIAAMGGLDTVPGVRTLVLEGSGEVFALGQNRTLTSDLLKWQVGTFRRAIDYERGQWRDESTRTPAFVTGWPSAFTLVQGLDGDVAFDIEDGSPSRLDALGLRDRRAELSHDLMGFLRAATAPDAKIERARREGGEGSLDLVTPNGDRVTLTIDSASRLPKRITSLGHEPTLGDVTVTTTFDDFADAGDGLKLPRRITRRIDDRVVADLRVVKTSVNAPTGDSSAPAEVRAASPPSPTSPARVTVEAVAPGIWYLAGEGHHSVVVEFADHLTLIEAPVNERRTQAVIVQARALQPKKPLRNVINTHHHFDHAGGIRTAIAEGLTVITHESNRAFFEQVAGRPSTVVPDALAMSPRSPVIETVADQKVLTDGTRRVEVYAISSVHCATMLMVYFPKERLLVEADLYQPPPVSGPPPVAHPHAATLVQEIARRGLKVDRVVPIHGRIVPFAELVSAATPTR